jgi:hypothetical protein
MKKKRIRYFKFSDGKQNLQFHWPNIKAGFFQRDVMPKGVFSIF